MNEWWPSDQLEQDVMEKAAEKRIPAYGVLELLPLCNMNCDMCYVRLSREEMEKKGGLRTAEEWLALAQQMRKEGTLFLMLTGGEPLIFPDFRRLYVELQKMGMIVALNTNGTLVDEDWAAFFGRYRPRRINVTLYGANEQAYEELCHYPGGYEKALRGIRLLRENGVDVKINGSAVKANREDCMRIAKTAREFGAAFHVDSYMYPATREREKPFSEQARLDPKAAARVSVEMMRAEEAPQQFIEEALNMLYCATHTSPGEEVPGQMRCRAGKCAFAVNWQGMMCPCVMLTEPKISVFEQGFRKSWRILTENTSKIRLSPKCGRCVLREVCGTCAACALYESGSYEGVPEYMCQYTIEKLNCLAQALQAMENGRNQDKRHDE